MTRRPLSWRAVPRAKPPYVYRPRPRRRVSPVRVKGIWTLRPDSISQAMRAFFWRHRMLEVAVIAFILTAAGFVVMWWILL